ncbi:MAG: hypothetical protein IJF69_05500 [Clostridia bacterium]|nr:hypothetical protein [Clostridia bacterium]
MNNLFGNVRKEYIFDIFNTAIDNSPTTRRAVSDATGLSFVTVGRVANALVELNILKQAHTYDKVQKRRSRVLSTKSYYWMGIYALAKDRFTFSIRDLSLRCIDTYTFFPNDSLFIDDQIVSFFKNAEFFALSKKYYSERCIGTAVLVPGEYSPTNDAVSSKSFYGLNTLRLKETIRPYCFKTEPYVVSAYSAFIERLRSNLTPTETLFSLFLNKENILGAYITPFDKGAVKLINTGELSACAYKSLDTVSKTAPDPDLFFDKIADIIFTMCHTVPVSRICVCGDLYSDFSAVSSFLYSSLANKFNSKKKIPPEVTGFDLYSLSEETISREMRTVWFCTEFVEEDFAKLLTKSLNLI